MIYKVVRDWLLNLENNIQKLFFGTYICRSNIWAYLAVLWLSSKKFGFVQTRKERNGGGWCFG